MKLIDDLMKDDKGVWSITKMAAFAAHVMFAAMFAKISLASGFVPDMWWVYGAFALGHAIVNKSSSQFKEFKERALGIESTTTLTKETTDVRVSTPQDPAV